MIGSESSLRGRWGPNRFSSGAATAAHDTCEWASQSTVITSQNDQRSAVPLEQFVAVTYE